MLQILAKPTELNLLYAGIHQHSKRKHHNISKKFKHFQLKSISLTDMPFCIVLSQNIKEGTCATKQLISKKPHRFEQKGKPWGSLAFNIHKLHALRTNIPHEPMPKCNGGTF